jgi:hypothetical protein
LVIFCIGQNGLLNPLRYFILKKHSEFILLFHHTREGVIWLMRNEEVINAIACCSIPFMALATCIQRLELEYVA